MEALRAEKMRLESEKEACCEQIEDRIVQKVFSEKALAIARMRQKCVRDA